jgi:hypothetical protein
MSKHGLSLLLSLSAALAGGCFGLFDSSSDDDAYDDGGGDSDWVSCPSHAGESCVMWDLSGSRDAARVEEDLRQACANSSDGDYGTLQHGRCSTAGAVLHCADAEAPIEITQERLPFEVVWYPSACGTAIEETCNYYGGTPLWLCPCGSSCGSDDGSGDGDGDDDGGGGSSTCQQSCNSDVDCNAGEACLSTVEGNKCLPPSCQTCWDNGQSCASSNGPSGCAFEGCEDTAGGSDTCGEPCGSSVDCSVGEACLESASGPVCVPPECDSCWAGEGYCTWNAQTCAYAGCE